MVSQPRCRAVVVVSARQGKQLVTLKSQKVVRGKLQTWAGCRHSVCAAQARLPTACCGCAQSPPGRTSVGAVAVCTSASRLLLQHITDGQHVGVVRSQVRLLSRGGMGSRRGGSVRVPQRARPGLGKRIKRWPRFVQFRWPLKILFNTAACVCGMPERDNAPPPCSHLDGQRSLQQRPPQVVAALQREGSRVGRFVGRRIEGQTTYPMSLRRNTEHRSTAHRTATHRTAPHPSSPPPGG